MATIDTEALDLILSTLDEYAERELPLATLLSIDRDDVFPTKVLHDLYDPEQIGLHLLFLPEEYGGLGGGAHEVYRVSEKLARVDLGVATGVLATFLGTDPIKVGGTPEQKAKWMGRIADEGLLVAYGATEPQAGSDLSALRTTATPRPANGQPEGYVINGQKQWISNGGVAKLYTILANAPGGPSWFVVEAGTPGLTAGKPEDKHGIRASNTASLYLENVIVPRDSLVGGVEGQGLAQAQAVFGYTRLMVAAFGLGGGWAALERAIRYGQQRMQGGSLLADKQGYTHKLLVPHACRLEAARAYIEWTAARLDAGEPGLATEGAIAKYTASEAGNAAAEAAIQALGGNGYTREYMVEKIKRDVRITTIYEGTSEILEWTMARDRWQFHLKTRGLHYADAAARARALHAKDPACGADAAAIALAALARVMERCRLDRLTHNQHVLFRLGELVAWAETAQAFAERASTPRPHVNGFDADALRAMARVYARQAAHKVVFDGAQWAVGAGQTDPAFFEGLPVGAAMAAQAGLVEDMNLVAQRLRDAFPG